MDAWKPEERAIYRFWNGTDTVAVDPMPMQLALSEYEGLDLEFKVMSGSQLVPAKEKTAATRNVVELSRKIFGVEPFREVEGQAHGLTDEECLQLFYHFMEWIAQKKSNTAGSPISTPITEPASSAEPSATTSASA